MDADELKDMIAAIKDADLRAVLEKLLEEIETLEERMAAPPIRMGQRPNADR